MFEVMDTVDWKELPGTRLFHDFLYAYDRVADLYPAAPFDTAGQRRVFESRQRYAAHQSAPVWRTVLAGWARDGAAADPEPRLDFLWITGQQPGVLGGPLYTLYKMHTAARLAAFWDERWGHVGSAFWVLSEDHDLVEALRVHSIDRDRPVTAPLPEDLAADRRPICAVPADDPAVRAVLAFHRDRLPRGLYRDEVARALDRAYQPGVTLDRAFCRYVATLDLAPAGMWTIPAHHDAVKAAALDLFERLVERWPELLAGWVDHTRRLERAGYHAQIRIYDGYFPMFLLRDGRRLRILYRSGHFQVPETGDRWTPAAFRRWLAEHVTEISCNVALRPLVQDHVFPTLGYVAGASEIAYYAQLSYLYRALDIPMPVLFPRLSLTLVPPRVQRRLRRSGLRARDLLTRPVDAWRPDRVPQPAWWDRLEQERQHWQELAQLLRSSLGTAAPGLDRALQRLTAGWDRLQRVLDRAHLEQDRAWRETRDLLAAWLRPDGSLQERALHAAVLYTMVGPALLEPVRELDLFQARHHIVAIR